MSRGLTTEGVKALDATLARHVERGDLPGLVALVARGEDVHVAAVGHNAFGDAGPIGRGARPPGRPTPGAGLPPGEEPGYLAVN